MIQAAGILFRTPDGRVLLVRRTAEGDHAGEWGIPGGKVEAGETAAQAALREAEEEVGFPPAESDGRDNLSLLTRRQRDGVDFTTYTVPVDRAFRPRLNAEHDAAGWFLPTDAPQPLHPGVGVALRRHGMDELGVARAIAAGEMTSPQRYQNLLLVDMRITGTGAAYRKGHDEYVWRDPSLYLTEDFLARCAGLPVLMEHPENSTLDSQEFADRIVGTIMLPYVKGNEVWGVAKILDEPTIRMIEQRRLSTSPAVVFRPDGGNRTATMQDGAKLLIEGKPALLDHLAICEAGVWDKGGEPSGVASTATNGGPNVAENEDKTNAKADGDEDANGKLDRMLAKLDSMSARLDALDGGQEGSGAGEGAAKEMPPAKPAMPAADANGTTGQYPAEIESMPYETEADRVRKDAACAGYDAQQKAKADAAKSEAEELAAQRRATEEARADAAELRRRLDAVEARTKLPDEAEMPALAAAQARADAVYAQHGAQAPRALAGESLISYRRRLADGVKQHSEAWKGIDLSALPDAALTVAEGSIYADAERAARNPVGLPDGELRPIRSKDETGRIITTWAGSPSAWLDQFRIPRRRLVAFNTDRKGA